MRTRTILNSKGEAMEKEIQIEIKGKGGELGKKAVEELVKLVGLLSGEGTEEELMKIVYTITGFVFCCDKCDREEAARYYAKMNACSFCKGRHFYTCTGFRCQEPMEKAFAYATGHPEVL